MEVFMALDYNIIGERLKQARLNKRLTQEKLAEMVSMSHRSIVRLENLHTIPTIETLITHFETVLYF